jgi:hypothetical protein
MNNFGLRSNRVSTTRVAFLPALALLAMTAFAGSVQAQIITVPNFSFENPTEATHPYQLLGTVNTTGAADLLPNWNYTEINTAVGYGLVATSSLTTPGTSVGSQAVYLQAYSGGSSETLTTANSLGTITANTKYTLTIAIGAPANWTGIPTGGVQTPSKTAAEVIFSLTGNGTAIAGASDTIAENLVSMGTLNDYTLTFTTGASGGAIGKDLGISLQAIKALYPGSVDPGLEAAIFDDVRLTEVSTVPEPGTWALMLGSMGFLVLLTRRNFLRS